MVLLISSVILGFFVSGWLIYTAFTEKRYWNLLWGYMMIGWAFIAVPAKIIVPPTNLLGMVFLTVTWPLSVIDFFIPEFDWMFIVPVEWYQYFFSF